MLNLLLDDSFPCHFLFRVISFPVSCLFSPVTCLSVCPPLYSAIYLSIYIMSVCLSAGNASLPLDNLIGRRRIAVRFCIIDWQLMYVEWRDWAAISRRRHHHGQHCSSSSSISRRTFDRMMDDACFVDTIVAGRQTPRHKSLSLPASKGTGPSPSVCLPTSQGYIPLWPTLITTLSFLIPPLLSLRNQTTLGGTGWITP